jgi:lysophospholipase L1-like esterase
VIILHGHNDISAGADGAASGAAFEIEQMVSEARNRGMRVFLCTVLPRRSGGNKGIPQLYLDDFNARLRIVAARQGVTLVDTYAALVTDTNRYIGIDGLHPTEAGYAKIADTLFQVIQSNLEVR